MIGRDHRAARTRRSFTRRPALFASLAVALVGLSALPAQASRAPTKAEKKAIRASFLKGRDVKTTIKKIRVSTADPRFASVAYSIAIEDPTAPRARRGGSDYAAPTPAIEKKVKGKKWKTVPKAPKKVKKDLKLKDAKSDIRVSGAHSALLTRPASCSGDDGGAGIYDPGSDTYLSVGFFGRSWSGPGWYGAYAVGSVAAIYGSQGQVLLYESGQSNDAFAASGRIYADYGWGLIFTDMSPPPPTSSPNSVHVEGEWICG
jgi:hypothetical protein